MIIMNLQLNEILELNFYLEQSQITIYQRMIEWW